MNIAYPIGIVKSSLTLPVNSEVSDLCYNSNMKYSQIISDPKILGGKPTISGTRISVELILDRIASGMSIKEILNDYPHLSAQNIQAAISYAKNLVTRKANQSKFETESATLYTHEISSG